MGENYSLRAFESQGISYEKVSSFMDREDHIANNAACMDQLGLTACCVQLLPENVIRVDLDNWKSVMLTPFLRRPLLIDLGGRTGNVIKVINRGAGGIDNVFSDDVRSRLNDAYNRRNALPARMPGKKGRPIVCIHARHGEVCDMPRRFIPSPEYRNLLADLQESMPDAEIHLYSTRWCEGDDPEIFVKYGVQMHVDDTGVFETWRRFIEADVLVTAVSSFSTVPALLRCNGIVVYRESHCPPLHDWFHWDATGVLDKEVFRQQCHNLFADDALAG